MTVDVVIPVHGNWNLTRRCLDSLQSRDACVREIIVVDDASPDDAAERLRERFGVRAVFLETNRGFSGACNAGAALCAADAILFLNNDTLVRPGAIARLAGVLAADDSIGAAGPKLLYADGTIQSAGYAFCEHADTWRLYAHLDGSIRQANAAGDFMFLSGAALLVRRDVFRTAGGFDEGFRNGVEDVDLCLRIWERGRRVRYVPDAEISHLEGASRGRTGSQRANWEHFLGRWRGSLASVPRYAAPPAPHFVVRWNDRTPVDRLVRAHLRLTFRTYDSVRATFAQVPGAAPLERLRSAFERRAVVTVNHAAPGGADVRWLAPRRAEDLAAEPLHARSIWVPSRTAAELVRAAGVAADRIAIVRLGFFASPAPDPNAPAVVVTDRTVARSALDAVLRAVQPHEAIVADLDDLHEPALRALRSAPVAVFACAGDAWGLLGGERLAAGARVAAPLGAPFLDVLPPQAAIAVAPERLPEAAAALFERADLGEIAREETLLRLPAFYEARRIEELGRAIAGGIPEPGPLEMTLAAARGLRSAARDDAAQPG